MKDSMLLGRLKAAQEAYAQKALRTPDRRDAFEYGYRVGVVAGFEAAINELLETFKEEKDGSRSDL